MTDRQPVPLTQADLVVASLYVNGADIWEIAEWLGISPESVKTRIRNLRLKIEDAGYRVGTRIWLYEFLAAPGLNYPRRWVLHRSNNPKATSQMRLAPPIRQRRTAPPWGMDSSGTSASLAD